MWNFAYRQKRIISAFVKAMQINFLPSAGSQFTLRSASHVKYGTLRKRCYSSRLIFNNLTKLTKILTQKKSLQQVLFHLSRRQQLNGLKTFETKTMHHSQFLILNVFTHQYHPSYFIKQSTLLKLSVTSLIKIFPSLCNLDKRCYSIIENLG